MVLVFVKHLNESVKGLKISSDYEVSAVRWRSVALGTQIIALHPTDSIFGRSLERASHGGAGQRDQFVGGRDPAHPAAHALR
jgi:hypothetical protein